MPVRVLQTLHYLYREHIWSSALNHLVATFQNHVSHHLLTIAQLLNKMGQNWTEVLLQVHQVLLQEQSHYFDRGKANFEIDVRNKFVNEA